MYFFLQENKYIISNDLNYPHCFLLMHTSALMILNATSSHIYLGSAFNFLAYSSRCRILDTALRKSLIFFLKCYVCLMKYILPDCYEQAKTVLAFVKAISRNILNLSLFWFLFIFWPWACERCVLLFAFELIGWIFQPIEINFLVVFNLVFKPGI